MSGNLKMITESLEAGRKASEEHSVRDFILQEIHAFKQDEEAAPAEGEQVVLEALRDFYSFHERNSLIYGENLDYLRWLRRSGYDGKIQCIYIDPPFFSKSKYDATITLRDGGGKLHKVKHLAYDDTFENSLPRYMAELSARLVLMKELLAEDGLIFVHLDWHSSHYVKILMDEIFGYQHFVNEIIWSYKSGGSGQKHFARKHDSILLYSKSDKYKFRIPQEKSYNRDFKPYHFRGVEEFHDEKGWYTLVNMKDVWNIDMVGRTSKERTGYATQKPLELMRRILEAATEEGDLVADFFCGSGSFLAAAEEAGRRWIGCDSEILALGLAKSRLSAAGARYEFLAEDGAEMYRFGGHIRRLREEALESGYRLVTCALESFVPEIDLGHVPFKDRELIERMTEEHPLGFVDYVMIDPDYDGTFKAEITRREDFEAMKYIERGRSAYIIVDVFGKEYRIG